MLENPRDQIVACRTGSTTGKRVLPKFVSWTRWTRLPGQSPSTRQRLGLTCSSVAVPEWYQSKRSVLPVKSVSKSGAVSGTYKHTVGRAEQLVRKIGRSRKSASLMTREGIRALLAAPAAHEGLSEPDRDAHDEQRDAEEERAHDDEHEGQRLLLLRSEDRHRGAFSSSTRGRRTGRPTRPP